TIVSPAGDRQKESLEKGGTSPSGAGGDTSPRQETKQEPPNACEPCGKSFRCPDQPPSTIPTRQLLTGQTGLTFLCPSSDGSKAADTAERVFKQMAAQMVC
ncbi:unnamed protein product, partial [Bubo scandiacus]